MMTKAIQNFIVKKISACAICNHCGRSVAFGSGKFVNRIPDINDCSTRISNGLQFPFGDFVCEECDDNPMT